MHEKGRERLDSWKEIAEYLRRESRTAMRWERQKGLPVHRVPGGRRQVVFAYPEELDAWLRGQEDSGDSFAPFHKESTNSSIPPRKLFISYRIWWILGPVLLVLLAGAGIVLYNGNRPWPAERITFSGHSIQAWDAEGRLSWEYQFPYMLSNAVARLGDRDGDGQNDFAVVIPTRMESDIDKSDEVMCLDGRGRVLWRYAPDLAFRSGSRHFDPPWVYAGETLTLTPRIKPRYVWVAYNQALWWPGCLIRLDMEGHASVRFTNSGWITKLTAFENQSGSWVLAGGINSEFDQAMLAVVKEDVLESASPHSEGLNYVLDECPIATPYRYFLFPRSELNLATSFPVNNAADIRSRAGEIEVRTSEAENAQGIYLFSSTFDLTAITRSDTYWDLHRKLEREGVVKHPVEVCPERTDPSIKGWDPEKGWTVVRPSSFPVSK